MAYNNNIGAAKDVHDCISSVVDNDEHHPALLGRFVIVASSINVHTYLFIIT